MDEKIREVIEHGSPVLEAALDQWQENGFRGVDMPGTSLRLWKDQDGIVHLTSFATGRRYARMAVIDYGVQFDHRVPAPVIAGAVAAALAQATL